MTKYDVRFKVNLVEQYLSGSNGYRGLVSAYGIEHSQLRRWVASYQLHGLSGLEKKHRFYNAEFKLKVLQHIAREGLSDRHAAALYDIRSTGSIGKWRREYDKGGLIALTPRRKGRPMKPPTSPSKLEAPDEARMQKALLEELAYLRAENAYLKKAEGLIRGGTERSAGEKAQVLQGLRPDYPLGLLLRAAGLSRSTFYYHVKAMSTQDKYAAIKSKIRMLYERHQGRYGYRRITAALRQAGEMINHKSVQRLMQQLGLQSLVRPKKYRSYRGAVGRIAPNLLERQFQAERPNQKWVTDVTEFHVNGQKLYLSPVMDLYNGEIIAWHTERRPVFRLVSSMLQKAFSRLKLSEKPLLHSDQGWQYQQTMYRKLLHEHAVVQSMSRKGNCLDNAAMESFFGTLKSEFFYLNHFESIEQLQTGIRQYIHYYNHERIRTKLKGLSPVQYRNQALLI